MIEQLISVIACVLVCFFAAARLSELQREGFAQVDGAHRARFILEVAGLLIVAGGAAGVAGEWFLGGMELHADTVLVVGAAIFGAGVSPLSKAMATARHEVRAIAASVHEEALELLHREH